MKTEIKKGDRIRVVKGNQKDLIGKEGIVQSEIMIFKIRGRNIQFDSEIRCVYETDLEKVN